MRVVPVSSHGVNKPTVMATVVAKPHAAVSFHCDSESDGDDSDRDSVASSRFYCSLTTASSSSASVKANLPPIGRRGGCGRVLYAYPRLCFALVLLGSAFGTGAYAAYFFALRVLDIAGVPYALATARTQLVATEITMRGAATCALNEIPPHAALWRAEIDQGLAPWKEKVDTYDALLAAAHGNLTRCAIMEIERLERIVTLPLNTTALPTTSASEDAKCVLDAVQDTVIRYASSASRSLSSTPFWNRVVGRVKQVLNTARVRQRVVEALNVTRRDHRDQKAKLLALAVNTSSEILAVVDAWMDELDKALEDEFETLGVADIRLPRLPDTTALQVLTGWNRGPLDKIAPFSLVSRAQFIAALRSIAGVNHDLSRAVDTLEQSLQELMVVVKRLDEHESKVRQELSEIQNATQTHVRETLAQFKAATAKLRNAITAQTRASITSFTEGVVDLFDLDRPDGWSSAWSRAFDTKNDMIPEEAKLDPEDEPWMERVQLNTTFDSLGKMLLAHTPDVVEQDAHRDALVFRASLYDASAVFVAIVMTWDFLARLGWFLGKLARLLTESYSDLPPVDIRDMTSITTLIDLWGVLKCRHDLTSVLDACVSEGSYVLETAIHFVLWVLLEIAGTLVLMAWNQAISERCRSKNGQLDLSVTTPSTLLIYIQTWLGDSSMASLAPVAVVAKQIDRLEKAIDDDEHAWRKRVQEAAQTHAQRLGRVMLEKRFILDVRESQASCSIQQATTGDDDLDSDSRCLFLPVEQLEPTAAWAPDAINAFHHERVESAINPEVLVSACLERHRDNQTSTASAQLVHQLDHAHSCLLDQTMYLAVASWWMVFVIMLALRLTARMLTKVAGMVFWRYLSADRLEVLAFSDESGVIQSPDRLQKAIRRHLRNIRWRVAARMFGIVLGFSSVLVIGLHVLPPRVVQPLG